MKEEKLQALDWETSIVHLREQSESRAWLITKVSLAVTFMSWIALVILTPFYKVVPLVFEVDRATGEASQVAIGQFDIKLTDAMSKHWVVEYVQRRERYSWNLLQADYDFTMALSGDTVKKFYKEIYAGDNALDKKLGENTEFRSPSTR